MADEPTATIVRESDAHDDNGGKREPSCISPVGPSNDVTLPGNRKVMEAHDADLEKASGGLGPSRESVLAAELQVPPSSGAFAEQQLSCVARGADSASDGVDQPAGARLCVASQRRTGGADDSKTFPGETRLSKCAAAGATAAAANIFDPAEDFVPPSDGRNGLLMHEVDTSSLLVAKSADESGDCMPSDAVDESPATSAVLLI